VTGTLGADYLRILVSQKEIGAGYRIISVLDTGTRRVLLDRGFVPVARTDVPAHDGIVTVQGNLQWPQETDGFTPEPDIAANIWFARDVEVMAQALDAEPLLVVAKQTSFDDAPVQPLPVDTSAIPNDHLTYAITWFSLAAIWITMSLAFILRARRAPTRTS
jgi:surfeit locus 1 family protein